MRANAVGQQIDQSAQRMGRGLRHVVEDLAHEGQRVFVLRFIASACKAANSRRAWLEMNFIGTRPTHSKSLSLATAQSTQTKAAGPARGGGIGQRMS